ncbi:MAG: epoxyqueuosine reductase QueH [Planctomycetia bacterium]|nr:epoxyqueuosine reductase QueH [Planctomycetia bacterium]
MFPHSLNHDNPPLLLHVCCAPCAGGCVERLLRENRKVRLFFSNSNIVSEEEFEKRLHSVRLLAEIYQLPLDVDAYDHTAWLKNVMEMRNEPEGGKRCRICFAWALGRTAMKAQQLGCHFTTSLTVSPHKSSKVIFDVGTQYAHFEKIDFKKQNGFQISRIIAKKHSFYLQNFCGCEFAIR